MLLFAAKINAQNTATIEGKVQLNATTTVSNIKVTLLDSNSTILVTTTTNIDGYYGFTISEDAINNSFQLMVNYTDTTADLLSNIELVNGDSKVYYFIQSVPNRTGTINLSAKDLERQSQTKIQEQIAAKNASFVTNKSGALLSTTNNKPVQYVVDGQILGNNNLNMVNGSVQQVNVLQR